MRKLLLALVALPALAVLAGATLLAWTHHAVRAERGPLPNSLALSVALLAADRPVRITYVNTATQPMPRSAVLDPDADPHPERAYVMSHPAFVLEWRDGRILLVDAGLTPEGARTFGKPIEQWTGAASIEPLESVTAALGEAVPRVRAAVFTHMHVDHVDGLTALCAAGAGPVDVFMTPAQARRRTHTTWGALGLVRSAPCARIHILEGADGLYRIPGFPGVVVVAAAGHTPGSQLVIAQEQTQDGDRLIYFAGDIANHHDGIVHDIGKPWAYRTFLVPEDEERMRELRAFLRAASERSGGTLILTAHDQLALEASGLPPYAPR